MKPMLPQAHKLAGVLLMLLPALSAVAEQPVITVLETSGTVEIREPDQDWRAAQVDEELPLGATISTGFGASALLQAGSAKLDVDQLTRMRIDELIREEGIERSELHLEVGRVDAQVDPVEDVQPDFELSSPVSTAAVRGTSFRFDGHRLEVRQGRVQLINRAGHWVTVGIGETSRSDGDAEASRPSDEAEREFTTSAYTRGAEERTTGGMERTVRTARTGTVVIDWNIVDED